MQNSSHHLKKHAIGMIIVLSIQYLFGMITNMFISFPEGQTEGQLWEFAWRQWPLAVHIIIGLLLFIGSIELCFRASRLKDRNWIISSFVSFIAIFAALAGGSQFVSKQSEGYSLLMAVTFLIALLSYFWGVYVAG